ncbi:MAG TPA: ClpXP adapter SpxH family protein, partial [Chryseosolibacter sp.]|nr:ClpXP adapter SpxH family protein [Chryseosolibacter sp.]
MKTIETPNAMMCDPETGLCEIPGASSMESDVNVTPDEKPVKILYFTDPICSSCWGIEPQLRKLKLEYGDYFDIEYRMGGLLKSWDTYGGRDVSGPTSVAQHWDEAGAHYDMPIDGDVWLEDPLHSSYPPSVAFKAAQLQGEKKALDFLRRIKEMVFLEKKNITRWEHLEQAGVDSGLEVATFQADYETRAKEMFEDDLAFARSMGVRGFPTIFFTD